MTVSEQRDLIRRLAGELAGIAGRPEQQEKINGWKSLNSLRPQRPMLWIMEIPWGEFENQVDELRPQCAEAQLRPIEQELRRKLFTARHLVCDEVVDDTWWFPLEIVGDGYGVEISEQQIPQGASGVRSHHYESAIKDFADIEKIQMPRVYHNEAGTLARREFLEGLFGDAMPVRASGPRRHWFAAWDTLVRWTGVTEVLMDLVDRPEFLHALMRHFTDAVQACLTQYEELGLLGYPHPLDHAGQGGAGYTDELPQPGYDPAHIRLMDHWGGATAQIFGEVSPAMHEEFALQYEIEVMSRFGLNYYGCCEPLHNKMHLMAKVPRLRKISISPWCDVAKATAQAQDRYVFSHKPNPACFAGDRLDLPRAEQELRSRLEQSGDMPCEVIMKDISTVRGDAQRLIDWCQMAYRVVKEYPDKAVKARRKS